MALALAPSALRATRIVAKSARSGAARRSVLAVRAFRDSDAPTSSKRAASTPTAETPEIVQQLTAKAEEYLAIAKSKWDASNEKPTIVAVGVASLLALYFTDNVVSTIDRIPLINTLFELVGLAVTGWTAYRFIAFPEEKETLKKGIEGFINKVGL